jgi:hypothetical protein
MPKGDSKIRCLRTADGCIIEFPALRNPALILRSSWFLSVWAFLFCVSVLKNSDYLLTVWAIFVASSLPLNTSRVATGKNGLTWQGNWRLFTHHADFKTEEIEEISAEKSQTWGYHRLVLRLRSGKKLTLGDHIPEKAQADWLARQLAQSLK